MIGYIYLTTNLINNKKYIGQRHWEDIDTINEDNYLGSGIILKQAINKNGRNNFKKEILYICHSEEELCSKEKEFIKMYNATENTNFYNIHEGGSGGNTRKGYTEEEMNLFKLKMKTARKNYSHSEETRKKISDAWNNRENHMKQEEYREMFRVRMSGKNNPMYGSKLSEEQKLKLLNSHNGFFAYNKGKTMSDDQKQKISETMKKAWENEKNREKWIASKIGKTRTDETKKKMSMASYNRYKTVPYDNNIIIYKCDKEWNIVNIYYGIDEYYKYHKTKTCRNLKNAVKNKTIFKGYYWYIEVESQSTIENVDIEKDNI